MLKKHSTIKSFKYAFTGLKTAITREPNFRIHLTITTIVLIMAILLQLDFSEFALLAFTIFFVLILELLNTMLEALVNLVSPEIRPEAKVAKDVSAAMVLLAAMMSVIIGLFLFIPKFLEFASRYN
ncbi:diacylglycerol kinase family protein [Candidatus Woesebacteria bacterium]|nr:diacylglycerol kinase family protein [Candidatus Woesebacteria bacterium]